MDAQIFVIIVVAFIIGALFGVYFSNQKEEVNFCDAVNRSPKPKPRNHIPGDTLFIRPISGEWDKTLNCILDNGKLVSLDSHCIKIKYKGKKIDIWIASFPCRFGYFNGYMTELAPLPHPPTMTRLKNLVDDIRDGKIPGIRAQEDKKFIEMRK